MADGMHFGIDSCEDFVELQSGQVQVMYPFNHSTMYLIFILVGIKQ